MKDSFSILHTMAYTFIALQELVLYNNYPSIYWNTAVLTVNSGSVEEDDFDAITEEDEGLSDANDDDSKDEDDNDTVEIEKSKQKNTDYGKVAKAIGDLQQRGVTISLPLVNQAGFSFIPDEKNNRIIFGLKGISGIGDDVAKTIINLRPYKSLEDFYQKITSIDKDDPVNTRIGNSKIITLIKAGAFDEIEGKPREDIMRDYIRMSTNLRKTLDMRSIKTILDFGIIPEKFDKMVRIIRFKDYVLRRQCFVKDDSRYKSKKIYVIKGDTDHLTRISESFFRDNFMDVMEEDRHYWYNSNGSIEFYDTDLKNAMNKKIAPLTDWLKTKEALDAYNNCLYEEQWNKYCEGSISKWEMDSVSFYYHDHELKNVNIDKYNIVDYNSLPEEPEIVGQYKWRGRMWNEYRISRIIGTVLDRDRTKHTVTLLTPTGVVTLKMYSGNFAHYNKRVTQPIIEKGEQKQQVIENSWFTRGNLLSVVGFRRGEVFVPKKYQKSVYNHTIQKIVEVKKDGDIILQSERKRVE